MGRQLDNTLDIKLTRMTAVVELLGRIHHPVLFDVSLNMDIKAISLLMSLMLHLTGAQLLDDGEVLWEN